MLDVLAEREKFIEENLGLVHSICKRFTGRGVEYDDLYQAGCMGLVKAYDAFDKERGLMFSTYAVPVIMGEVRRLFRDGGSVKVSRSVKELYLKITKEKQKLEQVLCCEPSVSQIASALSVGEEEVTEAICACQATVSLTYDSDDGVKENDLPTESIEESVTNKLILDEAFKILDDTEKQLMVYRYFKGFTQNKTAQILGISQVKVSRMERKILERLKNFLE